MEPDHAKISVRRQCELVGLNRATYYYEPATESKLNLMLMRLIDEQYLQTPFYGYRRMTQILRRQGHQVNPKRVSRLMQQMGIRDQIRANGHQSIRFTPICSETCRFVERIKSGVQTSPMCRCHLALCIWLLSLTGSVVSFLAGSCPIHSKHISASPRWNWRLSMDNLTFSTPTKARNLQPTPSPLPCLLAISASAWMGVDAL